MRLPHSLLFVLFCLGSALVTRAQSVRWEAAENGLSNSIMLVFENCEPDGQPALPAIPGVTFTLTGRSQSTNIVNFKVTHLLALTYIVRGPQNPPVRIPAFNVKTDKGALRVDPFDVTAPAVPLDSVASARLLPARPSVWAGEVFGLNYQLSASRRTNPQISPTFDWNATPLVAEDWSKPEVNEGVVGGERRVNVIFRTRAIAKSPNKVKLEAATHMLSIQTGTIGFGIISQPRMEQVSVTSDQPVIEVRPLPAGAPAGFSGAVGQFKLISKVVPEKAAVGEPVTWTLELSGAGNWPDLDGLPARTVSHDFQVVQPKAKRTPAEGKLFDVTLVEDVVLVPSKAGNYTLGPVTFAYFDPSSGTYKAITAPRTSLTITAPAAPQFNVTPAPGQASTIPETGITDPAPAAAPRKPVATATLPAGIPRDPLPGSAVARTPLSAQSVVLASVAPFFGAFLFWAWLALRRAQETDPVRPRREARDRLARTLARLGAPSGAERTQLLLAWQQDTAVLWQLNHSAPSAAAFHGGGAPPPRSTELASNNPAPAPGAPEWSALWSEADRCLYGPKSALPSDWVARAQAALAAKTVPGFKRLRLFLPQNLLPFAALIALGFTATALVVHAAELDGVAAYGKADFPAAEKAWRSALAKAPTDWIARHNLSLALEQQEHPGEAAAQAAAAFVQNPDHPAVRWHFVHSAEKLGSTSATLAAFATPDLRHSLARFASPATWQAGLISAAWAAAIGVGLLLFRAYGRGSRRLNWVALSLLGFGLTLATCATAAVLAYGQVADADAVIVARAGTLRSIPTEADTTQKTTPLAAGGIAISDKSFLGWRRLVFENGQTGWVRKEEIVPIWK